MESLGAQARHHLLRIAEICEFVGGIPESEYSHPVLNFVAALFTSDSILSDWEAKFWNDMLCRPAPISHAMDEIRAHAKEWEKNKDQVPDFLTKVHQYDLKRSTTHAFQLIQVLSLLAAAAQAADDHLSSREAAFTSNYLARLYRAIEPKHSCLVEGQSGKPATEFVPEQKPENLASLLAELNSLVGLAPVKVEVLALVNYVRVRQLRLQRGLNVGPLSLHMVFTGNPGTGKTTVARLISRIFHTIGLLRKGHLVEVDRSGLISGFVGQTALKVKEVTEKALGGTLFIDEAYMLAPENKREDYGEEAIGMLVKLMEDHRDDLVIVAAGYTKPMENFLSSNPGLRSRFNKFIEFPDYNAEELYEIFCALCQANHYTFEKPFAKAVIARIDQLLEEADETFGNARAIRNLYEKILFCHANRVAHLPSPNDEQLTTFTIEDLPA